MWFGLNNTLRFLVGWGIFSTKPYGSRSRNNLAAVCYISLSLFTFSMWIANAMSGEPAAAASARIAGMGAAMCPFLYGLHLHLMPGDVALQAYAVLPVIEKALSGRVAETQAAELAPIHWKKEAWLPCLHTLLMHYRGWSARMHSRQMLVDSSGQSLGRGGLQSIRRLL
ncbi:unnamed protein product [Symbiodinium sp. CCMP2456]|nr:unnamed protein product [Symbiodinium sp. CCMP2456]